MSRVVGILLVMFLAGCSEPDFRDTTGKGYDYQDFEGQWLVINYWATWCAPCIKEIPELIALDDNHDDIAVLGVNYDQPEPEEMARQIEDLKITFPVYERDPYQRFNIEKPEVLPTTVIVNPDGQLDQVLVGPQTEETLLRAIRG